MNRMTSNALIGEIFLVLQLAAGTMIYVGAATLLVLNFEVVSHRYTIHWWYTTLDLYCGSIGLYHLWPLSNVTFVFNLTLGPSIHAHPPKLLGLLVLVFLAKYVQGSESNYYNFK